MMQDPIVQDIRNARAKLFAECGEDLDRLLDRLQASESKDRDQVVSLEIWRKEHQTKTKAR